MKQWDIKYLRNKICLNIEELRRHLNKYGRNSLFFRNFIVIFCALLVLLLFNSISFYGRIEDNINNELKNSNLHFLQRICDMGVNVFKTSETIATNIAVQDYTQLFVTSDYESDAAVYEQNMSDFIKMYTLVYDYLDSVYVCTKNADRISVGNGITSFSQHTDARFLMELENLWDIELIGRKKNGVFPNLISFVRPITINDTLGQTSENDVLGFVCVNINAKKLGKIFGTINIDDKISQIMILDENNQILYSSDSTQIGSPAKDIPLISESAGQSGGYSEQKTTEDGSHIVSMMDVGYYGLRFCSVTPSADGWDIFWQIIQHIFSSIIFIVIGSILVAFLIAYWAYSPIISISSIFSDRYDEQLTLREKSGEMRFILSNIMQNIEKSREMEMEMHERLSVLRRASFMSLQVQINPHFIYNTLENLNWMAVELSDEDNKVSSSILALSKILRYSLETEGYFVSIEDEIRYAQLYVELLQMRYSDVFTARWNISDDILKYKTIRLSLQPLLENALQHGIRPKRSEGSVEISARMEDDYVVFAVEDDGVGMSGEDMFNLNERLKRDYLLESDHVGLCNVNQRLKIIFGDDYGVSVHPREEGKTGIRVQFVIPAIYEEFDIEEDFE